MGRFSRVRFFSRNAGHRFSALYAGQAKASADVYVVNTKHFGHIIVQVMEEMRSGN